VSTGDKVVLMACVSTAASYWEGVAIKGREDKEKIPVIFGSIAAIACWILVVIMAIEALAGGGK
jgi:hypothetical protein